MNRKKVKTKPCKHTKNNENEKEMYNLGVPTLTTFCGKKRRSHYPCKYSRWELFSNYLRNYFNNYCWRALYLRCFWGPGYA